MRTFTFPSRRLRLRADVDPRRADMGQHLVWNRSRTLREVVTGDGVVAGGAEQDDLVAVVRGVPLRPFAAAQ